MISGMTCFWTWEMVLPNQSRKDKIMSAITAAAVKELRERSGAGMMDAKKALEETNGDMEAAVDLLRAKGLATAAKKSSRTAAEGLVGVAVDGTKGTAVEVNSQTDFVAKNEQFQDFVRKVTGVALGVGANDAETILAAAYPDGGSVQEVLTNNIATIGENQVIRRAKHHFGQQWSRRFLCPQCRHRRHGRYRRSGRA
jgi:elongation factor Ts